jgi:hypothetical protein
VEAKRIGARSDREETNDVDASAYPSLMLHIQPSPRLGARHKAIEMPRSRFDSELAIKEAWRAVE